MLRLEIAFLTRRYHATPWGLAANEGEVEWPPSPWRIARALVSAWHRSGRADDGDGLDRLLSRLTQPPVFVLPRGSIGQTRHYMPTPSTPATTLRTKGHGTSLVLDAFVDVGPEGRAAVIWPDVDPSPDEMDLLDRLAPHVPYLGRSESVCEVVASRLPHPGSLRDGGDGVPVSALDDATEGDEGEVVRVLCLAPGVDAKALSRSPAANRAKGVLSPPGGVFVSYLRPSSALRPHRRRPSRREPIAKVALRFALSGPALPSITYALDVAETARARALSRVDDSQPEAVAALRGADREGTPLRGHAHCHYLVTDEDGDGRCDHLTVWCPSGLDRAAIAALDGGDPLHGRSLDEPIWPVLIEAIERDAQAVGPPGPLATARVWESHTPLVAVRRTKVRGGAVVDDLPSQILLELRRRDLPEPSSIELLTSAGRRHWGAFRLRRSGERSAVTRGLPITGARLEFDSPIPGPIAIGRHSHFGLGLFLPTR